MGIVVISSLENIWQKSGEADYSSLDDLKNRNGVYIFRDSKGQTLYVGEARKQDLKTRVTQNFSERDSGGTFRNNFMSNESTNFDMFKQGMLSANIIFIVTEKNDMLVRALESLLILILKPKHNKDT